MRRAATGAVWVLVLLLAALVCWRIVVTAMSDRLAHEHPEQALAWDPANPAALAALARQQLDRKEWAAARQTVLRLLQTEPLSQQGFAILSRVTVAEGDVQRAEALADIALRRAPHEPGPPAWLLGQRLEQGDYAQALDLVDRIWRIAPGMQARIYPILMELAEKPEFADALAEKLTVRPVWRASLIDSMMIKGSPVAIEHVFSGLQRRDALDAKEMGQWIDRLAKDGNWGEAYARWAGELPLSEMNTLRSVHNGGFESEPSGIGFDWRIGKSVDVLIDRDRLAGTDGSAALRLRFLGRRTERIPLHQWLLLAPGNYRLRFAARAQDIRSDRGLQWTIRCLDGRTDLAASDTLNGTFDWTEGNVEIAVPATRCLVQDLTLRNAGTKGAGTIVFGTLWFDDVAIDRIGP
jgi:tetratricopeptide (TPR) repeat protein